MGNAKNEIAYTLIRSARRTVAIQITKDGEVIVRCPNRMPVSAVESFLTEKQNWIQTHLQKQRQRPIEEAFTEQQLKALSDRTKDLLQQRLPELAEILKVSYEKVTVRKQRTRWGSCSSKGNLNFNCLLALVPPAVFDYVVVHELCHLKEMNHSAKFWAEVEKILPDYKECRKWLKDHGDGLIGRL